MTDRHEAETAAAAGALRRAADAWQHGNWANAPRRPDRVAERIANAQYVGDWLRARADAIDAAQPRDHQVWERPVVPGTDPRVDPVAARLILEIDAQGRAHVHEAVLAQLLTDAGWERTR